MVVILSPVVGVTLYYVGRKNFILIGQLSLIIGSIGIAFLPIIAQQKYEMDLNL